MRYRQTLHPLALVDNDKKMLAAVDGYVPYITIKIMLVTIVVYAPYILNIYASIDNK